MQILLIHNSVIGPQTLSVAEKITRILDDFGIKSILDDITQNTWNSHKPDAIIVLGGDGSIIKVAGHYADEAVPVLGINMGTVGFLSSLEVNEISTHFIYDFLSGNYQLDERMMLAIEIYVEDKLLSQHLSLNELCLKSPTAHMTQLGIEINGHLHNTNYRGDGLLITTPTGSTAYSLSAGGPIIDPELEVILITPLLSYLLSKRPLLISGNKTITLFNIDQSVISISIDGQHIVTPAKDFKVIVKQAENRFKLINLKGRDFFASVDRRLGQTGQ